MLYAKHWDYKVKADPFSPENLVAWLEKQPADRKYIWSDPRSCLIGQWLQSVGMTGDALGDKSCDMAEYRDDNPFFAIALGDTTACTFGAALARARKALAER